MATNIHPVSQEELMAYLDGELAVSEASAMAAHLEHCRECQSVAADLQSISRRLLDWQVEEADFPLPPMEFKKEVPAHRQPFGFWTRPWVWAGVAIAAVILVAIPWSTRPVVHLDQNGSPQEAPHQILELQQFSRSRPSAIAGGAFQSAAPAPPPPMQQPAAPAPSGPLIIRTAELSLTARNFEKSQQEMERILKSFHGYIAHLSVASPTDQGRTLDSTLKVPAAQLDALLSALKQLGRVDSESETGEEVTRRAVDVQARLANARNAEQRLTELLRDRTGKLSDVLAVEEQIDTVRGEIEQMQAEQDSLSHQIAFASLDLKISEEYKAPLAVDHSSSSTQIRNAAVDGYRGVVNMVIGLLMFLLDWGPRLLILALILFFPVRALWKRRKSATV